MLASDVYPWAKTPSKPSYTYSEVGAAASNHTHTNTSSIGGPYALSGHTHSNNSNIGGPYALSTHTHDTYASSSHTHSWSSITSKPSWIGDTKPTYTYSEVGAAASSHSHSGYVSSAEDLAPLIPSYAVKATTYNGQTVYTVYNVKGGVMAGAVISGWIVPLGSRGSGEYLKIGDRISGWYYGTLVS